jgi:N-acetylmuramoyl-L-alanine amidase
MTLPIRHHPSPNVEPRRGVARPDMLILHYTGMTSAAAALHWLSVPESKVSCHYLVDEDGGIVQMVDESLRAWHAGVSHWSGADDLNSHSIGIEIHNPGHGLGYRDFPEAQMHAVEALSRDIVVRNGIRPARVLAHSDVAPHRKIDPGEKFDWRRLWRAGVGHWVEPVPPGGDPGLAFGDADEEVRRAQDLFRSYGYGIEPTGRFDERTRFVVTAFQRHWRQAIVDGRLDASTLLTLERLIAAVPVA